jgi:RNA polymerase sigma factor (sigma-70 family)
VTTSLSRVDGPGDAELISAVRGGDVDAYGELFARHVDSARRLARQLAGPADADDLVSDAFTKVLLVLQRGGGPDLAFRAYLLTAIRRLHVDRLRSGSRLRSVGDLTPFDPGLPFQDTAVEGFENAAAARAFASLPERWQMVLWHTEVEQQKPADIAPLLGMSANSVSALAYRAREGLRQAFLSQHAVDPDDVDCAWTRDHLGAYIRGGLSRRDATRVDDHIESCRACAAVYLELTEVNSGLAGLLAPLLLGSAGLAYISSGSGSGTAAGLTAAKTWLTAHAAVSAVGGVAVTATAAATVYAVANLAGSHAPPQGSPPTLHRPTTSVSAPVTPGQHQTGGHRSHGPGSSHGKQGHGPGHGRTTSPSAHASASNPTVPTSAPTSAPTSGPTSLPTATGPSGGPSGGPTSQPTGPPPGQITFTSTPPTDPAFGSTYQVSATGPGSAIAFSVDPTTTGYGTAGASCTISGATVTFEHAGSCVIAADETAKAGAHATQEIVVPKADQTVSIQGTANAPVLHGTYTVNATSSSGLPVALEIDLTTRGNCTIVGSTVTFDHAGPCTIVADQPGNSDYKPAKADAQSIVVPRAAQTITFTSQAPTDVNVLDQYHVSATSTSGDPVSFSATGPCVVLDTTVTFAALGTCVIEASQPGNSDYLPVLPSTEFTQTVDVTTAYDLAVHIDPVLDGTGRPQQIDVTVSGLPANGTATLTATGPADLHPRGNGQCPCTIHGPSETLTFMYNTQQSPTATVSFSVVTTDSPDPYAGNDSETQTFPVPPAARLSGRRTQR